MGRVRASTVPELLIAFSGRPPPAPGQQRWRQPPLQIPLLPQLPLLPLGSARARRLGPSLWMCPPEMTQRGRVLTQSSQRSSMAMRSRPSWQIQMACDSHVVSFVVSQHSKNIEVLERSEKSACHAVLARVCVSACQLHGSPTSDLRVRRVCVSSPRAERAIEPRAPPGVCRVCECQHS